MFLFVFQRPTGQQREGGTFFMRVGEIKPYDQYNLYLYLNMFKFLYMYLYLYLRETGQQREKEGTFLMQVGEIKVYKQCVTS